MPHHWKSKVNGLGSIQEEENSSVQPLSNHRLSVAGHVFTLIISIKRCYDLDGSKDTFSCFRDGHGRTPLPPLTLGIKTGEPELQPSRSLHPVAFQGGYKEPSAIPRPEQSLCSKCSSFFYRSWR